MSTELKADLLSITAAADLTAADCIFHAVSFGGLIVANTSRVAGILRNKPKSGEQASVVYQGITKVMAGAAISTLGYPLTVTASGWLIAASSGGATIGRALTVAASGDLISAYVDFATIPAWPGV